MDNRSYSIGTLWKMTINDSLLPDNWETMNYNVSYSHLPTILHNLAYRVQILLFVG
jgi:hypothetical protein